MHWISWFPIKHHICIGYILSGHWDCFIKTNLAQYWKIATIYLATLLKYVFTLLIVFTSLKWDSFAHLVTAVSTAVKPNTVNIVFLCLDHGHERRCVGRPWSGEGISRGWLPDSCGWTRLCEHHQPVANHCRSSLQLTPRYHINPRTALAPQ